MTHIDEINLELYVLNASDISQRRPEIEAHLRECVECGTIHREIEEYYTEVRNLANAHEKALVSINGWVHPRLSVDQGRVMIVKRSVPVRAFHFAARHPIYSSVFSIAIILGAVLLLTDTTRKDLSPAQVKAVGEFLIVQNIEGDELWMKPIGAKFEENTKGLKYFDLFNVDNHGAKEVIVLSPKGVSSPDVASGTVLSYDAKGNERWRFQFKPDISFVGETFSSDYDLVAPVVTEDVDNDGHRDVILAVHHSDWWPSAVVRLDAISGKLESLYWHPGWVKIERYNYKGDSIAEILAAGYNNAFKKSCLLVLDPRKMEGHAPATAEYIPRGIQESAQKYYVLLPNPDLYELANHWTEGSGATTNSSGLIEMRAGRILPGGRPGEWVGVVMYFYFDNHLNCVKVRAGDDFGSIHLRMEREGRFTKKIDEQYLEELRRGVLYWDGERFINQPTEDRHYLARGGK